jgi:hypothetical protein
MSSVRATSDQPPDPGPVGRRPVDVLFFREKVVEKLDAGYVHLIPESQKIDNIRQPSR